MSNRFIHAADLHLDSPFVGIGTLREGLDDVMRDASLDAWDALIDCCLDEDAAFLVLAGDLFDRADGTPRGRSRVRRGIERLHAAGIRVFAIHGNHDPLSGRSPLQGLEGVTVFRKDVPTSETFEGPTGPVTVHGVSFGKREVTDNLALAFERGDAPGLHVGVLHCSLGEREGHGHYAPCSVGDLVAARMDYWALGHIHAYSEENAEPPIIYAGTLQGRSPKSGERGPHGAVVVEFEGDRVLSHRRVELDRVRFEAIDVAIDELDDEAALERELRRRAATVVAAAEGRLVLLRVTLTGRGPLHEVLVRDDLYDYAVRLVQASRITKGMCHPYAKEWVSWGAGPRACQNLILGAKAHAFFAGRTHITTDDIRTVALPVLRHRIIVNYAAVAEGIRSDDVIGELLKGVPAPADRAVA